MQPLIPGPWSDRFFDHITHDDIVAVFDFDYRQIIDFKNELGMWQCFYCLPCSLCLVPCFYRQNVKWEAEANHVALTHDGIKFVTDKRKAICGLSCQDRGKISKTVPFDKLTDCDVEEPAGTACCCCVQNVLTKVHVDTASSGSVGESGARMHELTLVGLKEPHEFKKKVWDMKRVMTGAAPAAMMQSIQGAETEMVPPGLGSAGRSSEMVGLLEEIRDELREQNKLIREGNVMGTPLNGPLPY